MVPKRTKKPAGHKDRRAKGWQILPNQLPLETSGKLKLTRPEGARDLTEGRAVNVGELGVLHQVHIVQHVEGFHAELEAHRFGEPDVLQQSKIDVEVRRSVDDRTADVTRLSRLNVEKHLALERCRTEALRTRRTPGPVRILRLQQKRRVDPVNVPVLFEDADIALNLIMRQS